MYSVRMNLFLRNVNKTLLLRLFCLVLLVFSDVSAWSQADAKRKQLEETKRRLEEEIAESNRMLGETQQAKKLSVQQVVLLQKQIRKREELLNAINTEISYLDEQIGTNQVVVERLSKNLAELKKEYARLIYYAWKNRSAYDRLMFIFSSKNFNQAYRRLKYLQQYTEYRRKQAEMILITQTSLSRKIGELEMQKGDKVKLMTNQAREKQKLDAEKNQKNKALNDLKKKEKEILAKLRQKEKEARNLQNQIARIINEEIKKSVPKQTEKGSQPNTKVLVGMTPEEQVLSSSFENNKGRLPWPTETGVISSTFGVHDHPLYEDVKIENYGIDILTRSGSQARVVFKGTVRYVLTVANKKAVMVKHGEYYTVYSNLDVVYVQAGQNIETKQAIGTVRTEAGEEKAELHFEIWKGNVRLDPALWLAGKR